MMPALSQYPLKGYDYPVDVLTAAKAGSLA